jgi:hypothetical protein
MDSNQEVNEGSVALSHNLVNVCAVLKVVCPDVCITTAKSIYKGPRWDTLDMMVCLTPLVGRETFSFHVAIASQ